MNYFYLLSIVLLFANDSFAQDNHVHNPVITPETAPAANATAHEHSITVVAELENTAAMPMDHSAIAMDSDEPPEGTRDPHAYSAGFTQAAGPYTLPPAQRLVLADEHSISSLLGNGVEYTPDSKTGNYELQAWRGTSFNKLVIKTDGAFTENDEYENETELLWGRAFAPFWDSQLGVRVDSRSEGENRQWFAAGVQGLAPYWFELDATAYLGSAGQTEFVFDSEYEMLITQRLILQPRAEFTVRGKDDPQNLLGSGLANAALSLRLRYEISRQFAPFIGVETEKNFGSTADLLNGNGESVKDTRYFAGVRFWF
tara:strand:- start:1451 stop:2392 length:942 start_codon:yes stop_codon:yes gene_type:complete